MTSYQQEDHILGALLGGGGWGWVLVLLLSIPRNRKVL